MKDIISKACTLLFTLLLVAGCGTTPVELKKNGSKETFVVNESYQRVYRTIKENGAECWESFLITAATSVSGAMYTDIKEAEVVVSMVGGLGTVTLGFFDIRSVDDNKTRVVVYYSNGAEHFYKLSKSWFYGNKSCESS